MDGHQTVFPDIITSRIEDIASAPLPGEEAPQYFDALRSAGEKILEMAQPEAQEAFQAMLTEMQDLSERLRRLYVRFAYLQGLQDGCKLREVLGGRPDGAGC